MFQFLRQMGGQLFLVDDGFILWYYIQPQNSSQNGVGTGSADAVGNGGEGKGGILNLNGVDFVAANVDDVSRATRQMQASLLVDTSAVWKSGRASMPIRCWATPPHMQHNG